MWTECVCAVQTTSNGITSSSGCWSLKETNCVLFGRCDVSARGTKHHPVFRLTSGLVHIPDNFSSAFLLAVLAAPYGSGGTSPTIQRRINWRKNISVLLKSVISVAASRLSQLLLFLPLPGILLLSFVLTVFSPAGATVQQITKHRLHWLLGLIERKASLVRSASACLCRNWHLCETSPHQAKKPGNLSAFEHLTRRSITLWEDSFQMRRQSRQAVSDKTAPPPTLLNKRDHGGNHPWRWMKIQQSNWCTSSFG